MTAERGVLRLRFTSADLLRTRVLAAPDPMWELVLSLSSLGPTGQLDERAAWRRGVRELLRAADGPQLARAGGLLRELVPVTGNFPDFLTPEPGMDVAGALDAVRGTPRHRLAADLDPVRLRREDRQLCQLLRDGDRESMAALVTALRGYYDRAVAPHWPEVLRRVTRDRDTRLGHTSDGGLDVMLRNLAPSIHWQWPYLTSAYSVDHTIDLGGRGLVLVPSYFCGRAVTLIDPKLTPVLVYPARRFEVDPVEIDRALRRLAPLIGATRARIMVNLTEAPSTSELAESIGMSIASASQQVAVLREAGFAVSRRDGRAVRHMLTGTGRTVLEGA